jgi:MraZ protein
MDELFIGSAICEVTTGGEILLPRRFYETSRLRSIDEFLFVGLHEESPCLVAFDRMHAMQRQFEVAERLARSPGSALDHHRLRRVYGFVDEAPIALDGRMLLPPLMRARGGIGANALLVATGARFEIWDLGYVLEHGPSDLITLATLLRLSQIGSEVVNVAAVSSAGPCSGARHPAQPGFCVQPVPAVLPRHDPVGGRSAA